MASLKKIAQHRAGFVSFFGNALEFFEFSVYGVFAPFLHQLFFPTGVELLSLLASWGAFAAAFFMRPVGALLFGYIGDNYSRKLALTSSILLMATATFVIGVLPTYHSIGLLSPFVLVVCRLCQGLSAGGEYNGSALFLIEQFGDKRPGFIGSIITASAMVGAIIGTLVGKACLSIEWEHAWRIPFIMGGFMGFTLFAMRYYLVEAHTNHENKSQEKESFVPYIKKHPMKFLKNTLVGALNGSLAYVLIGFSLLYMTRYRNIPMDQAFALNILGIFMFMIGSPIFGALYDKLGKTTYLPCAALWVFALIFPANYFLMVDALALNTVGISIIGLLTASIAGPSHAYLKDGIPASIRYRFVAVSFSLGMAILGGITPSLLTIIIDIYEVMMAPAMWVSCMALLLLGTTLVSRARSVMVRAVE